jgi:hypothetical protein
LADWGVQPTEIATLRTGHRLTVYTPGSTAGVPLNIIGSLAPPTGTDTEGIHDEVEALVQGILGLVGVTSDPLSGREHVLLANLIETAWAAGETLDLATLLLRIQDPPMRKLGVIELDTFFPRDDRIALMMRLNGLIASPSFAAWGQGPSIDIESMLWNSDGSANAAVVYLAHLSDEERQMVVTRILSKLVGWMRGQAGSSTLRALVYMDEVYGFVPPSAMPPSKKPLLTLFKQARAFGIGVILATQNPVDLDYKAIANAGTWMIGRLQTERDKARLLEGMSSAAGTVDLAAVDATISGLAKREFLLQRSGSSAPRTFGVRWAMSYLAGPISKDQIPRLPGEAAAIAGTTGVTAAPAAQEQTVVAPTQAATTQVTETAPVQAAPVQAAPVQAAPVQAAPVQTAPAAAVAADETPSMPAIADGIAVRFVDAAAPWASAIDATHGGRRLRPGIAIRCGLLFDDTASDLRHTETWEAVIFPLTAQPQATDAVAVDYDDRDLVESQPANTVFVLEDAPISTKALFADLQKAVRDRLVAERTTTVLANKALKLYSRPGESETDFRARCEAAADSAADADADKIRTRLEDKIKRIRDEIATAQQRADQLEAEASSSKTSEFINVGGSVLGAIFGGRSTVRSITNAMGKAASGRTRLQRASNRMETALARVEEKSGNLADLEAQLTEELADIAAHWDDIAAEIETISVALEKTDVTIEQVALVWVPTA